MIKLVSQNGHAVVRSSTEPIGNCFPSARTMEGGWGGTQEGEIAARAGLETRCNVTIRRVVAGFCGLGLLALPVAATANEPDDDAGQRKVDHVLLVSVDGMHQADLAWYAQTHPRSTLVRLMARGVDYANASTPFPSDSFPGMVGQVTGGNPSSTGIYYDDTWNHAVFPAGTTTCVGPAPGGEVTYFEALDLNLGALDAGQGIVPAGGKDPWSKILKMTGNPLDVINPAQLPVDPSTCTPIYPNQYLKVNTVFEVAHQHGLLTAWSASRL